MRPTLLLRWICNRGHVHHTMKGARVCEHRVARPAKPQQPAEHHPAPLLD